MFKRDKNFFGLTLTNVRPFSLNDILTFTSAPAAFKVKVSSYFTYELTDLAYIDFDKAKATKQRTIASALKRLFPNHHPHDHPITRVFSRSIRHHKKKAHRLVRFFLGWG